MSRENSQPKIIFVFCDDLGFGDPATPNHFVPVVPDETLADAPYILHLLPALQSNWPNAKIKVTLDAIEKIVPAANRVKLEF